MGTRPSPDRPAGKVPDSGPPPIPPEPMPPRRPKPRPEILRRLGEPQSPMLAILFAMALVASMIANGVLAARVNDKSKDVDQLRDKVNRQQEQLTSLQEQLTAGSNGNALARLARAVERLRGLKFARPVKPQLLSAAQLRRRIELEFDKNNPRRQTEALGLALQAYGILRPGQDLARLLLGIQLEAITGFYDTKTKELVIEARQASDPTPLDRFVLAHEEIHALTDQHYGLGRLDQLIEAGRDEEATAFTALAEGDATYGMLLYERDVLTAAERRQLDRERNVIPTEKLAGAPPALQEALLFPYTEGLDFVNELVRSGRRFSVVNEAYRDPPLSTEQILHPSKYLDRRDDPTRVTLPNVAAALGSGWRRLDEAEIGELDLRIVLDQFLPRSDAEDGAAGWDGGRVAVLESDGRVLVASLTTWDTRSEAREATDAFGRWLPLRYRNIGSDFRLRNQTGSGWASDDGAGAVFRRDHDVLVLIGPDRRSIERARTAFKGF